jgi:hypothetical protein
MAKSNDNGKWLELGRVVATPGVLQALSEAGETPAELLTRHQGGDWGVVPEEDKNLNDKALDEGLRVLSAYNLRTGVKVWVITEWDRSATTLLLPGEY